MQQSFIGAVQAWLLQTISLLHRKDELGFLGEFRYVYGSYEAR